MAKKERNIVFSPYSISTAMAMLYAGARGETAKEMAKTLHFTLPPERMHAAYGKLMRQMQGEITKPKAFQLNVANALWGQRGFPFLPEFRNRLERDYQSPLHEVDFMGDVEGSRRIINDWVREKSQKRTAWHESRIFSTRC